MSYRSAQDPEENLPDWLKALRKRQSDEERLDETEPTAPVPSEEGAQSELEPSEISDEGEPDWLREIRDRYRSDKGTAPQEPEPEAAALSDTQPHRPIKAEAQSESENAWTEKSDGLEPETEEPIIEEPAWLEPGAEEPVIDEIVPEEPEQPIQVPAFTESDESISPGELPSWLQALRPAGNFPKEDSRSGEMLPGSASPLEAAGPLAGLSGVLPTGPDTAGFSKPPTFSARLDVTEQQRLHAAAFKQLIDAETKTREEHNPSTALPARLLGAVIAGVLLVAVLFPLVSQSQSTPRPEVDEFPEAASIFNAIDVLPAGASVLVAFEVQPSLYGEVAPVSSAVLSHLLDKQAQISFVSTQPTGPALVERLLTEQLSSQPIVATGEYSNLGYLSGGMAAVRKLLNEEGSEFAMVLVVAGDAEDVRVWLEQGTGLLPNGLLAVTSAQANPLLRAYLQSDPLTLRGLVSGLQGAALYERMRGQDGLGRTYLDAYSYGLGAIVLLILFGGLYGRLTVLRPKAEPTGSPNAA